LTAGLKCSLFVQIITGVIITVVGGLVLYAFGVGRGKTSVVKVQGVKVRKTGKWVMLVSAVIVILGLALAGKSIGPGGEMNSDGLLWFGISLFGIMSFIIGKIVAWFQRI
jgi:hypothetical protein